MSLQVRSENGIQTVMLASGDRLPISLDGAPVRAFLPGWQAACVVDCFAPVFLLSLRHRDGDAATWILDAGMARIAGSLLELSPATRAAIRDRARTLFDLLLDDVLVAPRADRLQTAADLAWLCEPTLRELIGLVWPRLAATVTVIRPDAPEARTQLSARGLAQGDVEAALTGSLSEAFRSRMRGGELLCASPFGDGAIAADDALVLDRRLTAYQFASGPTRRRFYVVPDDYYETKMALYVPDAALYCVGPHGPTLETFLTTLLLHLACHGARLAQRLARPPVRLRPVNCLSDYPLLHIGHVVWNELAGIEELVALLAPDELPAICVLQDGQGNEPFGPVDVLFPEVAELMLRPRIGWDAVAAYFYDNDLFFMRYMTKFVRARLGRRLREQVAREPTLATERERADRFRDQGRVCVLLGLRIGNRTINDLEGFLAATIEQLASRLEPLVVVLDGGNSRLGLDATTSYGIFGPTAGEEPLLAELRVVLALRQRFLHHRIEIVSTVGAPLACSLFWTSQSRFFVAPWGAALAKYRWICNCPGFVMTNRFYLMNPQSDLPIYHSPAYVEAPSPMRLIALEDVEDAPGPERFYGNFLPRQQAVADAIDWLIAATAGEA